MRLRAQVSQLPLVEDIIVTECGIVVRLVEYDLACELVGGQLLGGGDRDRERDDLTRRDGLLGCAGARQRPKLLDQVFDGVRTAGVADRQSTRLNSSHYCAYRMAASD